MRWVIVTIPFIFILWQNASGQLSHGGMPLDVPALKSRSIPDVVMPVVMNSTLRQKSQEQHEQGNQLKPLAFAHGFEVELTPGKHGIWTKDVNGYDVWRLTIKSAGAFSLNLIFSDFRLPEGARLFLFNEKEGHYLGAYTPVNNKVSGKFAVSPVAGDELTVQYEVPAGTGRSKGFTISRINHDFTGILKYSERRPLGIPAGTCNIDINCGISGGWPDLGDAVCRIIVNGTEICSGVLLNNTAADAKPYILSAGHCYDKPEYAETSVYTFNYESPFCAPLDGDPSNSISGAVMKASSDSLDFALVELSIIPPPTYRPYFAGWDRSGSLPDSTASIHHPQGDIKKIAIDRDSPVITNFQSDYTQNGFLRILRWEEGVTEQGSSGSPLFSPAGNVIGTLTGGSATCHNPVNDYYSRFEMAWEYKNDSSRQLKHWLDPINKNPQVLEGKRYYSGDELCMELTYLTDEDEHETVHLYDDNLLAGYWGGTNIMSITEFAGRYTVRGDARLYGVSLGVGILNLLSPVSSSQITIKVYNGDSQPEDMIYSQSVSLRNMAKNAMNLIRFKEVVEPERTFFISFELSRLQLTEEFVIYQSLRESGMQNQFWFRQDNQWFNFEQSNNENYSITNVMSILACNVEGLVTDTPLVKTPMEAIIYPNPVKDRFIFEAGQPLLPEQIKVYNFTGQEIKVKAKLVYERKIEIDLSGNAPGVYFVRFNSEPGIVSKKLVFAPW